MAQLSVEDFTRHLRSDAVSKLARVKTLLYLAPPQLLEQLAERAAGLEYLIREYDGYLGSTETL